MSLLEAALTARMDLEYIQLASFSDHQGEVNPTSVLVHVELPQSLALHSGGHLLQQIAHRLQAKAAPEGEISVAKCLRTFDKASL